jgi:hypothetical protein
MSLKAKLSIVLKADDVVIAETQDAKLWLKMLTSIIEDHAGTDLPNAHGTQESPPHASAVSA